MQNMTRSTIYIQGEIDNLIQSNLEIVRLIRNAEADIAKHRLIRDNNHNLLNRLFLDHAEAQRIELWETMPKVVWQKRECYGDDLDFRVVGVIGPRQMRVGEMETGNVTLYKKDGTPTGLSTGSVIDMDKTFPGGFRWP